MKTVQNPRSPESFLSIFAPTEKLLPTGHANVMNLIMRHLGRLERQDIVEAALMLERGYRIVSMLNSNVRSRLHNNEIETLNKLLKKTWSKISSFPFPEQIEVEFTQENQAALRLLMQRIGSLQTTLDHFGAMLKNNARFKKVFTERRISFATQPIDETLTTLRNIEENLGESDELPVVKGALEAEAFLKISDDLAWFRLDGDSCPFESAVMGHCGSESNRHGELVNLFSLRRKISAGWKPVVTVAWHEVVDGKGFITQIKGPKNSKPQEKYFEAFVGLVLCPEILFMSSNSYKHETDILRSDLDKETLDFLIKKKGYDPFSETEWVKTLTNQDVCSWVDSFIGETYEPKRDKSIEIEAAQLVERKEIVSIFECNDPDYFFTNWLTGYVNHSDELKKFWEQANEGDYYDVSFTDREAVKDSTLLYDLKNKDSKLYARLEKATKYLDDEESIEDVILHHEDMSEVLDAFTGAYRDGIEIGTRDAAYQQAMGILDGFQFESEGGSKTFILHRDEKKPYIWDLRLSVDELKPLMIEFFNDGRDTSFISWALASTPNAHRSRRYSPIGEIDVSYEYDESVALERLLELLPEALDSFEKPKKEKNPKFKKMAYKDLIKEHTNLVKILKSGDKKSITKEMIEQEKELRSYIKESKK